MNLEGMFASYVSDLTFGAGMITAAVIIKALFHVGFC